jgi:hypothetical protein
MARRKFPNIWNVVCSHSLFGWVAMYFLRSVVMLCICHSYYKTFVGHIRISTVQSQACDVDTVTSRKSVLCWWIKSFTVIKKKSGMELEEEWKLQLVWVVSTKYLVFFYEEILQFVFTQIYCILSCTETVANRWIAQPHVRKWNISINTISQIDCYEDMIVHKLHIISFCYWHGIYKSFSSLMSWIHECSDFCP